WFELDADQLLPPGTKCKCGGQKFDKEEDILDVWFDSGVSHAAVLENTPGLIWPADLYLEGSDQHRGWFHSSLLAAVGTRGKAPYRAVLTHGYVVDGEGKKMSKSLGNVIAPQEVIDRYGAEVLRLWVASENYREDIRISDEILTRLADAYRRIRNTCRFLLGNLYDFSPSSHRVPYADLPEIDRYMLHRLQKLVERMRRAYRECDFHLFYHLIHNFCVVDLSAFYLDVLKDRLYTSRTNSRERRGAQTVLLDVLLALVKLMAPVLSFTAEEVWGYLPAGSVQEESVHLSQFPRESEEYQDEELASRWDTLLEVRAEVQKALELSRRNKEIGHPLEARVDLFLSDRLFESLAPYAEELRSLFIVSAVEIHRNTDAPADLYCSQNLEGCMIRVSRAEGSKCERCWNISRTVGKDARFPILCQRCVDVLDDHNS
ncbi:MAG TPA: class I tRNA ligase family protein, partial [bacterium]|nr:class I tRNA ligase family protein [bacterium]